MAPVECPLVVQEPLLKPLPAPHQDAQQETVGSSINVLWDVGVFRERMEAMPELQISQEKQQAPSMSFSHSLLKRTMQV